MRSLRWSRVLACSTISENLMGRSHFHPSLLIQPLIKPWCTFLLKRFHAFSCVRMMVGHRRLRCNFIKRLSPGHLGGVVNRAFEHAHGDLRSVGEFLCEFHSTGQ